MVVQIERYLYFSPSYFGDLAYVFWGIQTVTVSKPAFWGIWVSVYLQYEINVYAHAGIIKDGLW